VLEQKNPMGVVFLSHYQTLGLKEKCFRFFILVTNHQILMFGTRSLGGQFVKKLNSFT
jgi:hypothetical protein